MGKEFDALLVDTLAPTPEEPVFDVFKENSFDVSSIKGGPLPHAYKEKVLMTT